MNPTGQPFDYPGQPGAGPPVNARGMLNVPSILLIVAAVLVIGYALLSLVASASTGDKTPEWVFDLIKDPSLREKVREMTADTPQSRALSYGWPLAMLLANVGVIVGAVMMRSLRAYPLAILACIISIIPCMFTNCCCIFSMPAGIYALVVLLKPEVRAQFT